MLFDSVDLRKGTYEETKARKSRLLEEGYVYWGKMGAENLYAKAETEFESLIISCNSFVLKMQHSIENSHYKYGEARKGYPMLAKAIDCVEERLEYYLHGKYSKNIAPHNKDYLIDVANFAMIESMFPCYPGQFAVSKPDAASGWKSSFSTEFTQSFCSNAPQCEELRLWINSRNDLHGKNNVDCILALIALYRKEKLMQALKAIGYYAWQEYDNPTFEDSFYDINIAGDKLSPGLAGGISYKELMES